MVLTSDLSERAAVHAVEVALVGTRSNRDALGAVVRLTAGGTSYTKVLDGSTGYLSHGLLPLYFGLGAATVVERIEVDWPSGMRQVVLSPIAVGRRIEIRER